jgi:hypothetical protein
MRRTSLCFLAVLLTGCPTRPRSQGNDGGDTSDGPGDGDASDLKGDGADGADGDGGAPSITIISPATMTYANGHVLVQVQVANGAPLKVQLLRNDMAWQDLTPPLFKFDWDTAPAPDGDYVLTATAMIANDVVTAAPVTVTVDHTPPKVTDVTPAAGSSSVALAAPIQVTFSEPVLASTVTDGAVQLAAGGAAVASTAALAPDAKSLTVTITDPKALTLPADFTATIATTITDRAGNQLAPLQTPWTWTVPAWINLPPLKTDKPPRLAIDADRRPVVAYATLDTVNANSVYDLRVARFEAGAWNTAMGAPTTTPDTARNGYSIALDSKGQPVVAWTETFAQTVVHVGAWNGGGWNITFPALNAIVDLGSDGSLPSIQVDGSDRPVVAWREVTGNFPTYDIYVARWSGTDWTFLNGSGFQGGAGFMRLLDGPQLVLDGQGNPKFGWFDADMSSGVASWSGTTWLAGQGLIGGFTPYPVLDSAGAPWIAVKSADLHVLKWNSSMANWIEAGPTPLTTSASWSAPRLALGAGGAPIAAWLDTSNGVRIGLARWTGTTWDTRFGVFNAGQNPLNNIVPELAVDGQGKIWIAWQEGTAAQVWMSNY